MAINVGILGFAHGHVSTYCAQWRDSIHGVAVVAGWDHDAERLAKAAADFGVRPHDSTASLLADGIDAVVIGAETAMHADLVEEAAAAGKAIVLQKPLALTMREADRIVDAVDRASVPFTLAWQMRVDPQNIEMKRLIDQGVLGPIRHVRRRHCLSTHVWGDWFRESWHVKPTLNRGMWADDAAHPVDFMLWLLGVPETATAEIDTLVDSAVPDDTGIAIFRYADGMFAEVSCSFTAIAGENTTEIVGDSGIVIQNFGDAPSANAPRPDNAPGLKWYLQGASAWTISDIASPATHGDRIAALAAPLAAFLRRERGPIATAHEGRTALRLILASYRSAELGRKVALTEIN